MDKTKARFMVNSPLGHLGAESSAQQAIPAPELAKLCPKKYHFGMEDGECSKVAK